MNEENMNDDVSHTVRSESAFSGMSEDKTTRNTGSYHGRTESESKENLCRHVVHAIPYNHSLKIYVPKKLIPLHESKDDVIELLIARGKRPQKSLPLYTTHDPKTRRAIASLMQVSTKHRDRLIITSVSLYDVHRFLRDFSERPEGFENVEVGLYEANYQLKVDGVTLPLVNPRLRTFQGEAVLDLGIAERAMLRMRKGIHGFRLQLMPFREPIQSFSARQDALIIRYRTSKKWRRESVRVVDLPRDQRVAREGMQSVPEIRVLSAPSAFEGDTLVEISENLEKDARDRIRTASSWAEYTMIRGEIGEAIIEGILGLLDCPEIANHPQSQSVGFRNSEKKGPDSLRLLPWGETAYFEIKWWKEFDKAVWESRRRVKQYCKRFPGHNGVRVEQGYIAILDWEIGNVRAKLHIEKVT
ncbi:MAG TPA: hypothetical protein VFE91_03045 [Nitrososphaerales archaeon]|nr:hypothetical protein [Nitrososphaerales archaeon]